MRLNFRRSFGSFGLLALLLSTLLIVLGPSPSVLAEDEDEGAGHVYVLNNNLSGSNSITIFKRKEDGSLVLRGTTSIGGMGSLAAFSDGTQGSLILARNKDEDDGGKAWLFAADAGSDQISVLRVRGGHLSLVGVFSSGGSGPVSLTYQDGLLYVLNAANASPNAANVTGFHVAANGSLTPIAGSTRPLSAAHPNPAQVQIDPTGHYLLVTEKGTNLIDVYHINNNGTLSGPTTFPSVGAVPFGMAFNPASQRHEFVVADAAGGPNNTGAATSYRLLQGSVKPINGPVPDFQIAPCWMVITDDGRFAYTSNADSQTISGYRIHQDGTISLLTANGATASTPAGTFPIEESLSRHSRYLYVLESRLLLPTGPDPATLGGFLIRQNGNLSSVVDPAKITLPFSAIGLAAD